MTWSQSRLPHVNLSKAVLVSILLVLEPVGRAEEDSAPLPRGVRAVWDMSKAERENTPTRERVCINGLWKWQPAETASAQVPTRNWGYFKVPGCWPGITDYLQKDCQAVYPHPSWKGRGMRSLSAAWYQREITIPSRWASRRIALSAECLNSLASVFVDGRAVGEMRFPGGELDLTSICHTGGKHVISLLVVAAPLKAVMLSYTDTASARQVKGTVHRRGLCGDVYLLGSPGGARIDDVRVDTSVRLRRVSCTARLQGLAAGEHYSLRARIAQNGRAGTEFTSKVFTGSDLESGHITFPGSYKPERLWDLHTPGNMQSLSLSSLDAQSRVLDTFFNQRFGFREFWIDGRDFFLNGTRIFLFAVPLDNALLGAGLSTYEGARESMERLKGFGINFVYAHNLRLRTMVSSELRLDPAGRGRRGHARRTHPAALQSLRMEIACCRS
jgi:beta-galactosidase